MVFQAKCREGQVGGGERIYRLHKGERVVLKFTASVFSERPADHCKAGLFFYLS